MIVRREICKAALSGEECPLGSRCKFAHSRKELDLTTILERLDAGIVDDVNVFRSTLCFDQIATGSCPYQSKCNCIHDPRMIAMSSPAWLPKQMKKCDSFSTDIHVDWNHFAKQNIVNYGVNLPYRQQKRLFRGVESFYSIASGVDAVKDIKNTFASSNASTNAELLRLEVALAMMKKRDNCYVPYKYKPTHAIMDRLCAVINECAFEILPGREPGSSLILKEIPFVKYDSHNARHVSVHEVAFAPYGYSRCYQDIPLPMLLFNLDAKKVLRPATRRMIIAYENAKKDEVQQLTRQTIQERRNRRRISPFVPVPTKRFDKLIEDMRKVGKCHYPVLYSQDREMHDMIIDAIALRIDMLLGKELDAREKTRALEQKFTSLMRFYKDSVNAWPLCDGRGNILMLREDKESSFIITERVFFQVFFDNLDAVDDEFETVYPLLFGKKRPYDPSATATSSSEEQKPSKVVDEDSIDNTIDLFPVPDLTRVFEDLEKDWEPVVAKFQGEREENADARLLGDTLTTLNTWGLKSTIINTVG
ncbi:hypothetical protein CTEN210_06297 [Chaetoceros tenuissimus]|uniref:C3H1-type domain-containing protein n=1 Tax=Chaetoceros tenuissimus TaxID=426638 RepID=A0AAD3CRF8_9STRA|nr:hypothetical protein CTEN210_06297 [Chaetoceros tenuissimus]